MLLIVRVAKHGGGVAFFIKSNINYTMIEQLMVDVEFFVMPSCYIVFENTNNCKLFA